MTTFIDVLRTFDKNGWVFDSFFSFFFQIWEKLEVSFIAQTHAKIAQTQNTESRALKKFRYLCMITFGTSKASLMTCITVGCSISTSYLIEASF